MIFGQFLNSILESIEIVVEFCPVKNEELEALDHMIILTLDGSRYQILDDHYPDPSIWLITDTPLIVGDFHDEGTRFFLKEAIPDFLSLPSKITSISEFEHEFEGGYQFVGCEFLLESSGFSILTSPEDIFLKKRGAVWNWCQEWKIASNSKLTITNESL